MASVLEFGKQGIQNQTLKQAFNGGQSESTLSRVDSGKAQSWQLHQGSGLSYFLYLRRLWVIARVLSD